MALVVVKTTHSKTKQTKKAGGCFLMLINLLGIGKIET